MYYCLLLSFFFFSFNFKITFKKTIVIKCLECCYAIIKKYSILNKKKKKIIFNMNIQLKMYFDVMFIQASLWTIVSSVGDMCSDRGYEIVHNEQVQSL